MSKPEWRTIIESQLAANPQCNAYALSTVEGGAPRVRHVVHRGFTPTNVLLASTDLRMPKAAQLAADGAVEAAWLFAPAFVQIRVRGRGYTYPSFTASSGTGSGAGAGARPGPDSESTSSTSASTVVSSLPAHTSPDPTHRADEWKREWERMFHTATSPPLRATFARPAVPGSKLSAAPDPRTWPTVLRDDAEGIATADDAEAMKLAKQNFAVLMIEPLRVEVLDLKPSPHERVEWVLRDGAWVKEELVP